MSILRCPGKFEQLHEPSVQVFYLVLWTEMSGDSDDVFQPEVRVQNEICPIIYLEILE